MDKWCLAVIYQRALHSFSHFELRQGGATYFPAEADIIIRRACSLMDWNIKEMHWTSLSALSLEIITWGINSLDPWGVAIVSLQFVSPWYDDVTAKKPLHLQLLEN